MKPILYLAMDHVLVDVASGLNFVAKEVGEKYAGREDHIPGLYAKMDPVPGAVQAYHKLAETHDVYIVSADPWGNPTAGSDKLDWVARHLGKAARERLILTSAPRLLRGDLWITAEQQETFEFSGTVLSFRSKETPDWVAVLRTLATAR